MPTFEDQLSPPFLQVTENDHSAWLIVTSSLLVILTGLVVVVTLVSRVKTMGTLISSDWFLVGAMVCVYRRRLAFPLGSSR